ncbi:MAG: hypothetical protein GX303_06605 [Clostridiales bacterium]|nr:hypothetical protein [Clostridiales bacterium]
MSYVTTVKGKFLEYKGKPLVRENNTISYGNMTDEYILFMLILSYEKFLNTEVPSRILIQILSTDQTLSPHDRILKQGEKTNLFDAFDIGMIWLERALA